MRLKKKTSYKSKKRTGEIFNSYDVYYITSILTKMDYMKLFKMEVPKL